MSPSSRVTITVEADGWFGLAERFVAALERLVDPADQPGIAPAGPLILVPKGAKLDRSMSSIPLKKDGIQDLAAGNYDGPVAWTVVTGPAAVATETDDGLSGRISLNDDAAAGDVIEVDATADIRHGDGVVPSTASFVYNVVAEDAPPLTGADFHLVDKGAE